MNNETTRGAQRPAKPDFFPVRLLKNYRPIGDFKVEQVEENGKPVWRDPTEFEKMKTRAGERINIGIDEARSIIAKGIAERGDDL